MPRKTQDTYTETKVYESPGWKIIVHFPDLTIEERAKRQKELHDAAADLIRAHLALQRKQTER